MIGGPCSTTNIVKSEEAVVLGADVSLPGVCGDVWASMGLWRGDCWMLLLANIPCPNSRESGAGRA